MSDALRVFCFALLIRVIYISVFVDLAGLGTEDQIVYLTARQSVLEHGLFSVPPERVPGYPIVLALLSLPFGNNNLVLLGVQALIDSATCVLVGALTWSVLGRGFFVAGVLSALNLNMVVLSAMVLTDTLFLFFFTLFLYFLVRFAKQHSTMDHMCCLLFLCVATMVRSASYLLLPAVLCGLTIWSISVGTTAKRASIQLLTGIALVTALLGPLHMRNWQEYGSVSFVSQGGTTLLGWVVPASYQYSGQGSYQQGQVLARSRLEQALAGDGMNSLPMNPFDASEYQRVVAMSILKELGWANLVKAWCVGSVVNLAAPSAAFAPAVRAMKHSSFYETDGRGILEKIIKYVTNSTAASYLVILALGSVTSLIFLLGAVVGWWQFLRVSISTLATEDKAILVAFSFVVAYFLLITGPIIGVKYRLPIEPIMTVFATFAMYRFLPGIRR